MCKLVKQNVLDQICLAESKGTNACLLMLQEHFPQKLLLLEVLIIAVSTVSCSMHFLSRYIVGEVRFQFGKVFNLTEVKKVQKK